MKKRENFIFLYVLILALAIVMIFPRPVYATQTGVIEGMSAKVYEKTDENSTVVANVIYGSIFTILSEVTDVNGETWCFVQTDFGKKGYIKKEYVKQEVQESPEPQKKQQIEFIQNVNIRLEPTTESEIVGRVPQHTVLEPLQRQENEKGEIWYRIEYEGISGFVRESAVDITEVDASVRDVETEQQTSVGEAVKLETDVSTETELQSAEVEEIEEKDIQEADKQEGNKSEQKNIVEKETAQRVITKKVVNPIDGVVIGLCFGILLSMLLAVLVVKRMRKEQRKIADKNRNSRRKGKSI